MITQLTTEVKQTEEKAPSADAYPTSLVRLSGRCRHLPEKTSDSSIVAALLGAGERGKADAYMNCGQDTHTLRCESCGHKHTVVYHCKLRFCSRWGSTKLNLYMGKWMPYLETLDPVNVRTLMLSIKNVTDLRAGAKKIRACFNRLRHRKRYKALMEGGLSGIEGKPGKDGKWNVHLHCIYYGGYIPRGQLSLDWKEITGDSWYVYVKAHRNVSDALRYVLKYVTKGLNPDAPEWTGEDLVEFVVALSDMRLIQAFGCFLKHASKVYLVCPKCGESWWALLDEKGEKVSSAFQKLLRDFRKARPPPSLGRLYLSADE